MTGNPLAALLLLAACASPLAPSEPSQPYAWTPITVEGMVLARSCGDAHGLPLRRQPGSIQLRVVDADFIMVYGVEAAAFANGDTIWFVRAVEGAPDIFGHEYLHLIYGLPGRPGVQHPPIFAACGL